MTTVLSPLEFAHLVQVVRHRACGHRAECWCGWCSAWCDDYEIADAAATDHRVVAVGRESGLDAALSGLLDLQDDLADAVMWLAENWAADLPVPSAYPRCEFLDGEVRPGVRLLVFCESGQALAALADLLGEPVVADQSDRTGTRRQRAVRCFGRVHLEAYSELCAHSEANP
jgi:hypothetical protein